MSIIRSRHIKHALAFLLYCILAFALLSPMGSGDFVTTSQDMMTHTAAIVQHKMALQEGQFPARIAPAEYQGWGYPKFQFYAPTLYLITGFFYNTIFTENPYITFKIIIFLSFLIGAFFIYRLCWRLTQHFSAAFLSGFVYMASPYFLIDAHWRYTLSETLGLGVLPMVIYYTYRLFIEKDFSVRYWLMASFSWYLLMTIHMITFVNTTLFVGLFILFSCKKNSLLPICRVITACIWATILGAWFLAPAFLTAPFLFISQEFPRTLMKFNWLTTLQRLFSMTSMLPVSPHPGNITGPFYPAVGWPILIGVITSFFAICAGKMQENRRLIIILSLLFLLALLMAWSPVNFWSYLPKIFVISQYTYRFLSQVIWTGALLAGFSLTIIIGKNQSDWRIIPLGIWIIGFSSSSWLMLNYADNSEKTIDVHEIIQHPYLGYHHHQETNYLISPGTIPNQAKMTPQISVEKLQPFCHRVEENIHCQLPSSFAGGVTQMPAIYYPKLLTIDVDKHFSSYFPTVYSQKILLTGLSLSPGSHHIIIKFTGLVWANKVSWAAFILTMLAALGFFIRKLFYRLLN